MTLAHDWYLNPRCLDDGITQLKTTIRYTRRHLNGPCEREERVVKSITSCDKLPEEEFRGGPDYTVRLVNGNSSRSILRIYPCGTGGSKCKRRVVRVMAARASDGCRCVIRRSEDSESCCCNADGLLRDSEKSEKLQWTECDSSNHPIAFRQQKMWRLVDGKCWPTTFTLSTPIGMQVIIANKRNSRNEDDLFICLFIYLLFGSLFPQGGGAFCWCLRQWYSALPYYQICPRRMSVQGGSINWISTLL